MTQAALPRSREMRDWELFIDWCDSMDAVALPATAETISAFLTAFPAAIQTHGRRVETIRRAHERAGEPFAVPAAQRVSAFREGPEWTTLSRALAQVPKYRHRNGFHVALRGRRDGWLLVLIGQLRFSRGEARALQQTDVALFPRLTIRGEPVPKTEPAAECPACAVTRWLRVAGSASYGWWNEVKETVSPIGVDESAHDCAVGLDGSWRQAATLLPAIDRHGWVSGEPMSLRSISTVMAFRQVLGQVAEIQQSPRTIATGRFADATMTELADAYADVDQRAAALLLRLKEVVGEADDLVDHLNGFDL
jgi:hypothetical protein